LRRSPVAFGIVRVGRFAARWEERLAGFDTAFLSDFLEPFLATVGHCTQPACE